MATDRRSAVALVPLLLGASAVVLAAALAAPARADEGDFEYSTSESVPVEELLKAVRDRAGVPLLWEPRDKGIAAHEIAAPFEMKAKKAEILPALRSVLRFYELVVVPTGPKGSERLMVLDVRATSTMLRMRPEFVELTDENLAAYEGQDGLFVTTLVAAPPVRYVDAARNALARIVTPQNIGSVQDVPPSGFLVTDFAPNVVLCYRVLRRMSRQAADQPAGTEVRLLRLEHVRAPDLAALLSTQFAAATAPVPPGTPMRVAPADALRIQGEPRSNTLLVSGPPEEVARVLEVAKTLEGALTEAKPTAKAPSPAASPSERLREQMKTLKVSLDVEAQPIDEVLRTLEAATHVQIVVTPSARTTASFRSASITLRAHDLPMERMLDLICPAGSCRWNVEGDVVYVTDGAGR